MALVSGIKVRKFWPTISMGIGLCFTVACGPLASEQGADTQNITAPGNANLSMEVTLIDGELNSTRCGWMDFDNDGDLVQLSTGEPVTDAYASWGVNISTFEHSCVGNNYTPGLGIVFDSANPTGGDWDLGTPNQRYGGPGQGRAGWSNDIPLNGLLIKAENTTDANGDGLIDVPDDDARGARFRFDFNEDMCIQGLRMVDIDRNETTHVSLKDGSGSSVGDYWHGGWGNNSVQWLPFADCGVREMEVAIPRSGAIANLSICTQMPSSYSVEVHDDFDDVSDIEFDVEVIGQRAPGGWMPIASGHFKQFPGMLNLGGALPNAPLTPNASPGHYTHLKMRLNNIETVHYDGTRVSHPASEWAVMNHNFHIPSCGAFTLDIDYELNYASAMNFTEAALGLVFASATTASSSCNP